MGSADDADDVTAEVFTVAWRRRGDWPPAEERRLWLFGIAHNVLSTHRRSIGRQERLAERLVALGEVGPRRPDPAMPDPTVWLALARLDADDRDLLIMRAWDHLAVTEMAELLGCTTNAVSIRLSRARARLRTELDQLSAEGKPPAGKDRGVVGHEEDTRSTEETNS